MALASMILIAAIAFSIAAYVQYFRDIKNGVIVPNRWSWLIWSVATAVEALTYEAVSDDWMKSIVFFIAAISCFGITVRIWSEATWKKPDWTEVVCVIASGFALLLWLQFQLTLWAHLLMVLAVPVAFVPTWKSAIGNPNNERSRAWGWWSIGDLLTLIVILVRFDKVEELPFILVEFACHAVVWQMQRKEK
ncbi:MAG: hypothetical protein AAB794_03745 [Patescibacteria group bacterium]